MNIDVQSVQTNHVGSLLVNSMLFIFVGEYLFTEQFIEFIKSEFEALVPLITKKCQFC